jgi:two-component system, cell cycle sensor histidine kinase and response regulator CckA
LRFHTSARRGDEHTKSVTSGGGPLPPGRARPTWGIDDPASLQNVIEQIPDVVAILDAAHAITAVSSAAERTLGYPPNECVGLPALDFVHPDDREAAARWLAALNATPPSTPSHAPVEFRVRRRDGRWRMIEPTATNFVDANGVRRELVLARDVTDRRQLERQLQSAQRSEAIGNLAAGIAHDFNNVLTAIVGWSDALIQSLPDAAPALSYAREIREASQHAADLATHLLAIRRDERVQAGPLNLNDVVIRAAPLLRRLLGQRVECILRLTPGVGLIQADATQMEQVLLNLALNARDAMPDGGILTIETAGITLGPAEVAGCEPGGYIRLTVRDTGIGMDADVRARVFEPFFTTKGVGQGSGLGLSIINGIVRQVGGGVTVESHPGHGATFRVFMPRLEQMRPPPLEVDPPEPPVAGRPVGTL